jgi:predicted AlkP superfamily pyrophosphatase or phosphodiesterase
MKIDAPSEANEPNPIIKELIDKTFGKEKADRVFMFNPDAIAEWIYEKYKMLEKELGRHTEVSVPLCSVMPSVTPVCFGTMYTGAQPSVHGIRKYEKPVIAIDSIFDSLIRAGKKAAIVAQTNCSMSMIYLGRDMDYFIYDTIEKVNAKAAELIIEDKYDFLAVYNGNYDSVMHKHGPESLEALCELRANVEAFATFSELIKRRWGAHDTLVGFAMDHGCHEIDGGCGSHGLDMLEDINIVHLYKGYPKNK